MVEKIFVVGKVLKHVFIHGIIFACQLWSSL